MTAWLMFLGVESIIKCLAFFVWFCILGESGAFLVAQQQGYLA